MGGKRKQKRKKAKSKSSSGRLNAVGNAALAEAQSLDATEATPSEAPASHDAPSEETSADHSGVHAITPPSGEEHRAHPRVVVAVSVSLESESHFFAGLSGDVSEGGVFVQTYRDIPVGSDVEVQFELPEGSLKAHGRVRWHRDHSDSSPPGVGIAFDDLPEEDRRVIQHFCERRAPLYYDVEHA